MKTSQLKMIIREVVREEIRLGLQEIIGTPIKPRSNELRKVNRDEKLYPDGCFYKFVFFYSSH